MNDPLTSVMILCAMLAAGTIMCILAGAIAHLFRRPLSRLADRLMGD